MSERSTNTTTATSSAGDRSIVSFVPPARVRGHARAHMRNRAHRKAYASPGTYGRFACERRVSLPSWLRGLGTRTRRGASARAHAREHTCPHEDAA
eukprot:4909955-Alexandrium_andersonii.AAC.1